MSNNNTYRDFLGANSANGFFSLYDYLIDLETANEVYIIKSGPGSGKSSFMRRVTKPLSDAGLLTEHICCSSDPDSLDGVVFPELGLAFVDGTSPHVVEPVYPNITDRYLDLNRFCRPEMLSSCSNEIKNTFKTYKAFYSSVYGNIKASKLIEDDVIFSVNSPSALARTAKRADGIIKREIKNTGNESHETKRFLSALSPKGYITDFSITEVLCDRVYEIVDNFGLGNYFLHRIYAAARQRGAYVICCFSPMSPDRLEHLIFPELRIAFITTNKQRKYTKKPYRRIKLDEYIEKDILDRKKQKLKFMQKTASALIDEAILGLKEAKSLHDQLEKLYNPSIDFESLYEYAEVFGTKLAKKYL